MLMVTEIAAQKGMPLLHPMIGQKLNLKNAGEQERWWERVAQKRDAPDIQGSARR